jgi:hypothetical protein
VTAGRAAFAVAFAGAFPVVDAVSGDSASVDGTVDFFAGFFVASFFAGVFFAVVFFAGFSGAGSSGCSSRVRPSRSARRRTMSE